MLYTYVYVKSLHDNADWYVVRTVASWVYFAVSGMVAVTGAPKRPMSPIQKKAVHYFADTDWKLRKMQEM